MVTPFYWLSLPFTQNLHDSENLLLNSPIALAYKMCKPLILILILILVLVLATFLLNLGTKKHNQTLLFNRVNFK